MTDNLYDIEMRDNKGYVISTLEAQPRTFADMFGENRGVADSVRHVSIVFDDGSIIDYHLVQKPTVECVQCRNNDRLNRLAMWLDPRISSVTKQVNGNVYQYEYVATCEACHADWWGTDNKDRPVSAPGSHYIPDGHK